MKFYCENDIDTVFMMLGSKCNMKCRHCVQEEYDTPAVDNKLAGITIKYLKHLAAIRPDNQPKLNIRFWGGEPLLFFEDIKNIVSILGTDFEYSMISNGLSLNQSIVDYLNANNISFVLSCDGPYTSMVRGSNILEVQSFYELFMKVERRSVNCIITAYSQDFEEVWDYFDKKKIGCYINFEQLIYNWSMPADLYDFNLDKLRNDLVKIGDKAFHDTVNGVYSREVDIMEMYKHTIIKSVKNIENKRTTVEHYPPCAQVKKVMNINPAGKVFACHNTNDCIGTVEDDYYELVERFKKKYGELQADCKNCEFGSICRGACPMKLQGAGTQAICAARKVIIKATLDYIMKFDDQRLFTPIELIE